LPVAAGFDVTRYIAGVAGVLLSELDAAGHTDALEMPLLLSSDVIVADIELDQRPVVVVSL
jgi:hypothetical protein